MHMVMLSDHPGAMLADAVSRSQRGPTEQETALNEVLRRHDEARAERRWLRWLRLTFTVRREQRELARHALLGRRPCWAAGPAEPLTSGSRGRSRQKNADISTKIKWAYVIHVAATT